MAVALGWGHGYATEAAQATVAWARCQWPDLPVIARVRPDNAASAAVAANAGLIWYPELDCEGFDGWDLILASGWSASASD